MSKPILWLVLAPLHQRGLDLVLPSLSWQAEAAGARCEGYFECERDGKLFATTGSTVLGGMHHQQFNWLAASHDLRIVRYGDAQVFASSIAALELPILADSADPAEVYRCLLPLAGQPEAVLLGPAGPLAAGAASLDLAPYCFPEIVFRRALAFPADQVASAIAAARAAGLDEVLALHADDSACAAVRAAGLALCEIDRLSPGEGWAEATGRIAHRWTRRAAGVAFGDPAAIRAQLADHCTRHRVALFAPVERKQAAAVSASSYAESVSPMAEEAARLALACGDPVLVGRQTGDGDLRLWSRCGVCMQIIDPNRPAFPVVASQPLAWGPRPGGWWDDEADDDQLATWADEGRVLTSLVWHSGEIAHTEAMLNLVELAGWHGIKMGLGVHAQRYQTSPQLWELIGIPRTHGGAKGLIEPVLHSGGLGVCAEMEMDPAVLGAFCRRALECIRAIAGAAGCPRGYYAFLDTDLETLLQRRPELWDAVLDSGLDYAVSSVAPGRNRVLHRQGHGMVINQTSRVVHAASPFVRLTTPEDLDTAPHTGAGWIVGVLDAPVTAFTPYIWRHGTRTIALFDALRARGRINVLPHTIGRYARLLAARGQVPADGGVA